MSASRQDGAVLSHDRPPGGDLEEQCAALPGRRHGRHRPRRPWPASASSATTTRSCRPWAVFRFAAQVRLLDRHAKQQGLYRYAAAEPEEMVFL